MRHRHRVPRAVPRPWRDLANDPRDRTEGGFTLIELLIVTAVLPLVIGAIAVALISVFSLQTSVSGRLSDSGDAQVVSANFESDVQSATLLTTDTGTPAAPLALPPCETATQATASDPQVLGLQGESGQTGATHSEISYVEVQSGTVYSLVRNVCQIGSTIPVTSSVVSSDVPSGQSATVTCTTAGASQCAGTPPLYQSSWIPTNGVSGVSFAVVQGGLSKYSYTLVAVPQASSPAVAQSTTATPNSSCGFATPGTGTYASSLCFVDFSAWGTQQGPTGQTWTCNASGTPSGALAMSSAIANTPYTLDFCLSIASTDGNGNSVSGTGNEHDGVDAVPLPTYYDPPQSEAFLGNNGFYTGVPGDPALYTVPPVNTSIVTITQIQVLDSNGNPATGWELVTGDAESTDANPESLTWSASWNSQSTVPAPDQFLNLLPNSPTSPYGNACPNSSGVGGGDLTAIPATTVTCTASPVNGQIGTDKTGTVMLWALAPSDLTVTMYTKGGLQAMFLGLLLPS